MSHDASLPVSTARASLISLVAMAIIATTVWHRGDPKVLFP